LDMPTWHYVNHPLFHRGERPITFNLGTKPQGPPSIGMSPKLSLTLKRYSRASHRPLKRHWPIVGCFIS
jgi:hypothetical protein